MAIDYIIDLDCIPKQAMTTEGILDRLKGRERAHAIINLFRESGDPRPPSEMGFEFTRRTPEGEEETRIIIVQDLLDDAEALSSLESHCVGCPANRTGSPFGCMNFIQYPITEQAENWLLDQLPVPDEPLVWLLVRQVIKEFKYDGSTVREWRDAEGIFFESPNVIGRRLGELNVDSNQMFEVLFGRRPYIIPRQAVLLLMFLKAIDRDLEADEIRELDPAPANVEDVYPLILMDSPEDDATISQLKAFLRALYTAWALNVNLLVDA
jgi:hypothetical protein